MKMNLPVWKWLPLVAGAMLGCALNLPAQTLPTITTQPASQTNLAGTSVTFTVAVSGTGPFTYQWQFNGVNLPNNIMSTVAGTSSYGYNGDGVLATGAELNYPYGMALDSAGNVYIADTGNSRIRKVAANGIITTVAGTNSAGYSGDGGAAINASLNIPHGVTVDSAGNLYISDEGNNCIRKVGTNGIISTFAGNGTKAFYGDGGAASKASLSVPLAWLWTLSAMSILPTAPTIAFARWAPMASSPQWRARTARGIPGTAARPLTPNCTYPLA